MPEEKKLFGQILTENSSVTQENLDIGLHYQQTTMNGRKLGEILCRLGYISVDTIIETLRLQGNDSTGTELAQEIFNGLLDPIPLPGKAEDAGADYAEMQKTTDTTGITRSERRIISDSGIAKN